MALSKFWLPRNCLWSVYLPCAGVAAMCQRAWLVSFFLIKLFMVIMVVAVEAGSPK